MAHIIGAMRATVRPVRAQPRIELGMAWRGVQSIQHLHGLHRR
jgi:hypothetical protein